MKSPINLNSDDCVDGEDFTSLYSNQETKSPSSPVRLMGLKMPKQAKVKGKQGMTKKEEMSISISNNMQYINKLYHHCRFIHHSIHNFGLLN